MFPEDLSEFFKGLTFTINGQPFLNAIGRIKDLEEKKVTTFKVGDRVRLKDKFYDEDDFKNDERCIREAIAKIKGRSWKIETFTSFASQQRACSSEKHCFYSIPVSLLELVETPVVEPVKKTIEPKVGMWAEVIREHCGKPVGSIVKIVEVLENGRVFYECKKTEHPRGTFVAYADRLKLLPNYKPLRKWTDAEIMEAKLIIAEIYAISAYKMACSHGWDKSENAYLCVVGYCGKMFEAKCCPTDEPNTYIGLMVALCKATGRKLPSWIRKDGTK